MSKEKPTPTCQEVGVECSFADQPGFCRILKEWRKMGPAYQKEMIIKQFPGGKCQIIAKKQTP
jgi:hypothetical protein